MPRAKVFKLMYEVPDSDAEILEQRFRDRTLGTNFWRDVTRNLKTGGGVSDKNGHNKEIRTVIHPSMYNLIQKFKEDNPDWYGTNTSKAIRSLLYNGIIFTNIISYVDGKKTTIEKSLQRLKILLRPIEQIEEIEVLKQKRSKLMDSHVIKESKKLRMVDEINECIEEIESELNDGALE
jgi:hypothetical protein